MSDGFEIRVRVRWNVIAYVVAVALLMIAASVLVASVVCVVQNAELDGELRASEQLRSDTNARIVQHFTRGVRK